MYIYPSFMAQSTARKITSSNVSISWIKDVTMLQGDPM